jgi:tyrosyl-tRNA synthetase
MDFLQELEWRGMLHQQTPGLEELLASGPQVAYIGFDPTAKSLTIGNYVQIMLLNLWQRAGHRPIVLMGGATGRIGDPSGKDEERQLKSFDELDGNLAAQIKQIKTLLDFEGENGAILANNLDFYGEMSAIDFLRDVGKTLTINYMLAKDSVKNRIETGMSFTEFSYQLLQGYDFAKLHDLHGCKVQMGGSDQWGNITGGIEFVRRQQSEKVFAVTTPLLTKADGSKFGKSEAGNIWMSGEYTSPFEFYQFWLRGADADLEKFVKYFSLRPREEMQDMIDRIDGDPNGVKRELGEELTLRIHGTAGLKMAKNVTNLLYGRSSTPEELAELDAPTLKSLDGKIDTFRVPLATFVSSTSLIDFLADSTEAVSSKSEARRAIQGNAISINKEKIADVEATVNQSQLLHGRYLLLENGKKRKYLVIAE